MKRHISTASLAAAALALDLSGAAAQTTSRGECRIPEARKTALVDLSFEAFDQDPAGGWRPWFEAGCLADTAALIEAYIAAHPETAKAEPVLHFHAAQAHAFRGDYDAARSHLPAARYGADRPGRLPAEEWNAYLRATEAFLARDRAALEAIYEEMGGGEPEAPRSLYAPPPERKRKMANLEVVERLLDCFDKPYREAYGGCRPSGEGR